ncbi:hypothetical protein VP01_404g5 [Puccinia sorghi]|uniref:HAT C-terminal dimerisation domain-containing protein n=1 Tax=Puccinia sorghi TaxID=27349 RepID=A0A0L6URQ8_9BASI|nr:hypothetical protein VP01_404g5 [Puccinia sorghi]
MSKEPTNPTRNIIKDGLFTKMKTKVTSLSEEMNIYLESESKDKSIKPIQYWKSNSSQYPTLANMSRTFRAVPALSAPCEQVFFARCYIQNYTLNFLTLETLEFLICLKDWIKHNNEDIDSID